MASPSNILTADEAIECFNEDMSNAVTTAQRDQATRILGRRLGDHERAQDCRDAWMGQHNATEREIRANGW